MKKSNSFRSTCLLILLAGCFGYASAAPYGPDGREIKWVQPTGQKLALRVFGDEYYARTETAEGYTVAYNSNDGAYYYAAVSADGSKLVPSALRADQPADASLPKHLNLTLEKIKESTNAKHTKYDVERRKHWEERVGAYQKLRAAADGVALKPSEAAQAKILAAPVTGNKVGLTILVQFPNDPLTAAADPVNFPTTRAKIIRYCNSVGYTEDGNTGSVHDFYADQSDGRLNYTQAVTQIVTMPKARNYYNFADYPTNTTFRDNSGDLLVTDAITALKAANFDFTVLTTDSSNQAIATNLFFAGPDSGVWAQGLWPYQTSLPSAISVGTSAKPVFISIYQQTNIDSAAPVIGTFCHENGHMLCGYSDLYDYGGESEGVGDHCLMGGGNYNNGGKTPSPINAYFKDVVGWGNVVDIAPTDYKTVSLSTTGNIAYRMRKPGTPTEYFIVENRGSGDRWAQYSVDKGIAIWHIDETKNGDNEEQMTSALHYEVSLEQADGAFDLENGRNRGDSQDLFDLSTPKFFDSTTPNARWWDGTKSGVKVQVSSAVGASTKVLFGDIPADTILVDSPNGGEVIFRETTYNITWRANIVGNVKVELLRGGAPYSVLAASVPNTGTYAWKVAAGLPAGNKYTIQISSVTNPVPTKDASNAPFTISDSTFPPNNQIPYGWFTPSSASTGWTVTKSVSYEGDYSLTNKPVGDGKTAAIAYKSDFNAGNVSFYYRVSSEVGFDYARFYIDDIAQPLVNGAGGKGISGTTGWIPVTYSLSAGVHTLKWTYEKDDSYASGKDAAWLDGVSLPTTTQKIAVQYPVGTNLVSGQSTIKLPYASLGYSSKTQLITIKNVGGADLTGLSASKSGTNASDFILGTLANTTLKPGASTTLSVTFKPSDLGTRTAQIKILSNDENQPTFVFGVIASGKGLPILSVAQPSSTVLKDGKNTIDFGIATVNTTGSSKTFTITNTGSATLKSLVLAVVGSNPTDFIASPLGVTSLDPKESTTFTVKFKPTDKNTRKAEIRIKSNDKMTGTFNIGVTGTGAPKQAASAAPLASSPSSGQSFAAAVLGTDGLKAAINAPTTTSVEVVDGRKYLALTVAKPAGTSGLVRTVEVSSDLLDWYSGIKHTTVLINDETTLKVRDNTPTRADAKRYIRLKVTEP